MNKEDLQLGITVKHKPNYFCKELPVIAVIRSYITYADIYPDRKWQLWNITTDETVRVTEQVLLEQYDLVCKPELKMVTALCIDDELYVVEQHVNDDSIRLHKYVEQYTP